MPDEQDKIDAMFEEMFGYKADNAPASPETPPEAPKRPSKPQTPDPTPEDVDKAARAVRDAVAADKRRRPVKTWKSIVKESLGVSYLKTSWWTGVLERGVELGLFKRDEETLSYPYLIALAEPEPELKAEDETPETVSGAEPWKPKPIKPPPPEEERRFTYHLACGHTSNWLRKRTTEEGEEGEEGEEEIYCHACHLKTPADHVWMSVNRGVPIPPRRRRSEQNPHGDCCDAEGQYIGGLEGDCRYAHLKDESKPVCKYHEDKPLWGRKP